MISCPPPKRFSAAVGVRNAEFLSCKPQFIRRGRSYGRFAVGIRYEREAQEFLSLFALGKAEIEYKNGPWIEYQDKSGKRWCQPDALLINRGRKDCIICEVKYQHTSAAWWQLKQLYLPVLRVALSGFSFRLLEIVHWYDPLTLWPERQLMVEEIDHVPSGEAVAICIFNQRRERRILEARNSHGKGAGKEAGSLWPAQGAE